LKPTFAAGCLIYAITLPKLRLSRKHLDSQQNLFIFSFLLRMRF